MSDYFTGFRNPERFREAIKPLVSGGLLAKYWGISRKSANARLNRDRTGWVGGLETLRKSLEVGLSLQDVALQAIESTCGEEAAEKAAEAVMGMDREQAAACAALLDATNAGDSTAHEAALLLVISKGYIMGWD